MGLKEGTPPHEEWEQMRVRANAPELDIYRAGRCILRLCASSELERGAGQPAWSTTRAWRSHLRLRAQSKKEVSGRYTFCGVVCLTLPCARAAGASIPRTLESGRPGREARGAHGRTDSLGGASLLQSRNAWCSWSAVSCGDVSGRNLIRIKGVWVALSEPF